MSDTQHRPYCYRPALHVVTRVDIPPATIIHGDEVIELLPVDVVVVYCGPPAFVAAPVRA